MSTAHRWPAARLLALIALIAPPLLTACDDDDDEPPPCVTDGDCPGDRACATVEGEDELQCIAPVHITGQVIAAEDGAGIADARVLALGANGEARTGVVFTDADGFYSLPVSMDRTAEGRPLSEQLTLRVDAAARQPFPVPPRVALPLDLAEATLDGGDDDSDADDRWTIENAATTVSLFELPPAARGVTVSGYVDHDAPGGVLLLAEAGGRAVSSSIVDLDRGFVLYDVPPGDVTLVGYRAGLHVPPTDLDVGDGGAESVVLQAEGTDGVVQGSVSIVNAPGGSQTTVILVPDSAFDAQVVRGPAVAGLRAAPVSGGFTIDAVPPGRYAVLAAFENDDLVRDPDTGIGGTAIVRVDVGAGESVDLAAGFKVTEALAVRGPGAERIDRVQGAPVVMSWADDSSEDGYELRVYDAFGVLVHSDLDVDRVTGSDTVSARWDGPLEPGMIYQFRAASYRDDGDARRYISLTEDLRGVFRAPD